MKEVHVSKDQDSIEEFARHTYGTWRKQSQWKHPLLIEDAEGVYFRDDAGKKYLDLSSQLMCSNLGHKNASIIGAIKRQAERLPYVAPGFTTHAALDAVQALRRVFPPGLQRYFFSTSGTEANEAALKIVRQYKAPKYKIISRYRSYHGSTPGSITFTGDPRRDIAERARCTIEGVRFAPDAYCYRCPFGLAYPGCKIQCARYIEYMIGEEGNVAGLIVEPVVGTNGRIVPPPEYFPLLRQICDRHGVLMIADEVMSGWYRTGRPFAMEHWNVNPDVMTTAKGCSGAYMPVGITVTTSEIADYFEEEPLDHGHTYSYHPLALSAIPAAIDEYERLMQSGQPQKVSEYIKGKLYELAERHRCIGDVRGLGHFWALELVKDRETKEPFNTKWDKFGSEMLMTSKIAADAMERGVYVAAWYDNLIVAPPLIITEDEFDEAFIALDRALQLGDKEARETTVRASRSSEFKPI
jgi:taurine--2-oxoglutarate transaminase